MYSGNERTRKTVVRKPNPPRLKMLTSNPSQVIKRQEEKNKSAPVELAAPARGSYSKKQLVKRQLLAAPPPKLAKAAPVYKSKMLAPQLLVNTSTANSRTGELLKLKLDEMIERPLEEESSVARRKSSALDTAAPTPQSTVHTPGAELLSKGARYARNAR